MCNKLIVLCLALVVMSVPALASYIGFDQDGNPGVNPLKVDLTYAPDPQAPLTGWQNWGFQRSWTGPVSKNFVNADQQQVWEVPGAELNVHESSLAAPANGGLSRNRSGGFAGVSGSDAGYGAGNYGYGTTYLKLTLTDLQPDTEYKLKCWDMELRSVWSAASSNPDSKFVAWSTTNPLDWLNANGYGAGGANTSLPKGGYGPIVSVDQGISGPRTDSNMPAGLLADVLARTSLINEDGSDHLGSNQNVSTFWAPTNDDGTLVVYAWLDATDWAGSAHCPLNGFMVVPEPVTIALLGLGGLALIRRKRA